MHGETIRDRCESVPREWLVRTKARMQSLFERVAIADSTELAALVHGELDQIEACSEPLLSPALRLWLVDLCRRTVAIIHSRQPLPRCTCDDIAWDGVRAITAINAGDPRPVFHRWLDRFLSHAAAQHPPTPADRAGVLMRTVPQRAWTLSSLSEATGVHHVRLARQFEDTYGVRPASYLHLVRVARAVTRFRTSAKVEAIAWEVGYRSKKDLYAALARWVGATPTELRALSDDEREWLTRELTRRCVNGISGARRAPAGRPASRRSPPLRQSASPLHK